MVGDSFQAASGIRIVHLEADLLTFRLKQPLAISFHTLNQQKNLLLRLRDDSGRVGWGEAAPLKAITGDSIEETAAEAAGLRSEQFPLLVNIEAFHADYAVRLRSNTLKAALDFAIHDLVAQRLGVPVYRLYADAPALVPNAVTVFLQDSPESTGREAARLLEQHPHLRLLKIKLRGRDDLDRCRAVKSECPSEIQYILDANQGFPDKRRAAGEIGEIAALLGDVLLVEEPCQKGDCDSMAYVREALDGVPIFADESCVDAKDLETLIKAGCVDGINVKLQKAGGISPAKAMADRAQRAGLKVMLGAMFETPLSHSAGAHFAVSTPNVILTDLDMDLDLPDFCTGRLPFRNGVRLPLQAPGFGFEFDAEKVRRLAASKVLQVRNVAVHSTQ